MMQAEVGMGSKAAVAGTVLLFGTLWGASEVLLGEGLRALEIPRASIVLTVVAVLLLGLAARRLSQPGALLAVALVAGAYRVATAGPFWCHVLAVVGLGAVFDGLRLLLRAGAWGRGRAFVLGALAAFCGHALFGVLATWVFAFRHWTGDGGERFRHYVLVSGGIAAAAGAILLPLVLALDSRPAAVARVPGDRARRPAMAWASVGLAALLWAAGLVLA
jgi:hypothetical protein